MSDDRPIRTCKTCGWRTVSTSTIDFCIKCGDEDGLEPKHFLTRQASQQQGVDCPRHGVQIGLGSTCTLCTTSPKSDGGP